VIRDPVKWSAYQKQRYKESRLRALAILGNKCDSCGDDELDHLQLTYKDGSISGSPPSRILNISKARFDVEIKKCKAICLRCYNINRYQ